MATKVAINGFGRIGRLVARALLERTDHDLELVAINDLASADANALLFQYDSTHGRFPGSVSVEGNALVVNGKTIAVTSEREPGKLPHGDMGVDIVLECTGFFQSDEACRPHLDAGAKRVLISAPAKGVSATIVFGVNDETLTAEDVIVSNASCTTNCLSPMAKVLQSLGIRRGMVVSGSVGDQRMDELSTLGENTIAEFYQDRGFATSTLNPADLPLPDATLEELAGGDAETNADIIRAILSGTETGAKRDAVLLNAGAALFVAGKADTISTGMELAGVVIDDGRAIKKLNSLAH